MSDVVEILAPAKINLRLKVLAQYTSGYHALESIFCAISLADRIRIESTGGAGVELITSGGIDTGPAEDNLVVRAARLFNLEIGGVDRGIRIELHKDIPSAAGLGGGSSDAAATLRALNALHGDPLPAHRLIELGTQLGSDVPFFLCGSAFAIGWGRGERLLSLEPPSSRTVLIAHPGVAMPTGQAFQRIAELRGGGYDPPGMSIDIRSLGDWDALARLAENDFEEVAIERVPQLALARDAMLAEGATMALLAGSGASIFGVYSHEENARASSRRVGELGFATWVAHTLQAMPEPRRVKKLH